MHIPDGILDPKVWVSSAAVTGVVLYKSVKYSQRMLEHRAVPVMGAMAAFIFAAQMINFPLLGAAASGHLIGAAVCAILFGFWPSTLIMSTVVIIQAVMFQDGGITALGANILNMAIVAPAAAALTHKLLQKLSLPGGVSAIISGWLSVVIVAGVGALELALSGVVSLQLAMSTLLFWHAFIGIGEGLITAVVLQFALRSSFAFAAKEMAS